MLTNRSFQILVPALIPKRIRLGEYTEMTLKKPLIVLLLLVTVLIIFSVSVSADSSVTGIMVNNQLLQLNNFQPVVKDGVTLVPAKELAVALGGTFSYNADKMSGTIRIGENELSFKLDDSIASFDGRLITAPASMSIINDRFVVPAEFVSKQFGAQVYMNAAKGTLMIFKPIDGKIIYKVVSGDSLWKVSNLFGTTITTIKQLNNWTQDYIYVGQMLTVKNYIPNPVQIPAVTSGSATLRTGAGFDAGIVGYLAKGVSITVTGKSGDWYKVITPKGNGYIYYTVTGITQDIVDNTPRSTYFDSQIPVDTSMDSVTYNQYTVQKGDNIWSISQKFGITDYDLAAANSMTRDAALYPGQILKIPVHNIPVKPTLGPQFGEVLDWFSEAQYLFPIGKIGKLIDMDTGKSFMVKRTIGSSHSDTETLTAQDTDIMKSIFGGSWTWNRKAFILECDGRHYAVSVAGMPHAGVDGAPFLANVDNRSDGWGTGPNYDQISGNGMDGHFDMFFLNSRRHVDNQFDSGHQYDVLVAGGLQ